MIVVRLCSSFALIGPSSAFLPSLCTCRAKTVRYKAESGPSARKSSASRVYMSSTIGNAALQRNGVACMSPGTVNGFKFNLQANFPPLLATAAKDALMGPDWQPHEGDYDAGATLTVSGTEKHHPLLLTLLAKELGCAPADIADFELQLCDTQPAQIGGALDEFIFSGRLDNLANCYCSLRALIETGKTLADEPNVCFFSV